MTGIPFDSNLTNDQKIDFLTRENAYFIWENRVRNEWPGDALSDWLEAEEFVRQSFPLLFYKPFGVLIHISRRNENGKNICPVCALSLDEKQTIGRIKCPRCGETLELVSI